MAERRHMQVLGVDGGRSSLRQESQHMVAGASVAFHGWQQTGQRAGTYIVLITITAFHAVSAGGRLQALEEIVTTARAKDRTNKRRRDVLVGMKRAG